MYMCVYVCVCAVHSTDVGDHPREAGRGASATEARLGCHSEDGRAGREPQLPGGCHREGQEVHVHVHVMMCMYMYVQCVYIHVFK